MRILYCTVTRGHCGRTLNLTFDLMRVANGNEWRSLSIPRHPPYVRATQQKSP